MTTDIKELVKRLREPHVRRAAETNLQAAVRRQNERDDAADALEAMAGELERLRADKDGAYSERNQLVAFLTRCFPSWRSRTNIPGWSPEWHGCVYIETPEGQLSWHYHDREAHLFAHLAQYPRTWDGHTTEEKYQRLARLQPDTAERDRLAGEVERWRGIVALRDGEVERLKEERDAARDDEELMSKAKQLCETERDRLKAALEQIKALGFGSPTYKLGRNIKKAVEIARKALGGNAS